MTTATMDLAERYSSALRQFVSSGGDEAALLEGYDCGRQAIFDGVGVLNLLSHHHDVLLSSILGPFLQEEARRLTDMASYFLSQSLAPFEMTFRGFEESNMSLRRLNDTLEQRVKERTRELENALHSLQSVVDGTVLAMSRIVEAKDPYTAGHERRVAQLACAIAKEIGLAEDRIRGIHTAGLLHDVGKMGVPVEILSKPGRLSQTEFMIIKTHCEVGADVLGQIEFPWPVASIVSQHHERLDGSGYPSGLSGEAILLEARILGVADVVEAMASHRPYRPALGTSVALDEITQNKGILYDAGVADACLRLFAERRFQFE